MSFVAASSSFSDLENAGLVAFANEIGKFKIASSNTHAMPSYGVLARFGRWLDGFQGSLLYSLPYTWEVGSPGIGILMLLAMLPAFLVSPIIAVCLAFLSILMFVDLVLHQTRRFSLLKHLAELLVCFACDVFSKLVPASRNWRYLDAGGKLLLSFMKEFLGKYPAAGEILYPWLAKNRHSTPSVNDLFTFARMAARHEKRERGWRIYSNLGGPSLNGSWVAHATHAAWMKSFDKEKPEENQATLEVCLGEFPSISRPVNMEILKTNMSQCPFLADHASPKPRL